ncbi:phosphoribosylformylglycinamidine cyclo-ligase [Halalkalibacterium halodurans]|uniref:phosphoribosylformylglycinamidine cyclo-ligase n=1 Tax=Halalkalibacterium halodurans TaxID=86665 RepID=UPI002E1A8187|nr:phosphoribosylformylglycinamidine cyclo-ligase [Halalkalibacterium halodurans]MED4172531.1 phosphoribosylformylglycinamidine cyclo-ligase [Halalkalibacterium halodurans]
MSDAYKQAGVDIEAGYEAVARMKKHVLRTARPEVIGGLGSFGGMFDLSALNMKEPVLVSGTDGVGTKLMLAFQMNKHDTIGVDAVAMCVNDIVVQGAEPLYFLDYIACGKSEPARIEAIVKGIADGCEQAGCALIGGETAEMPGMYDETEYDVAGFAVGAVEKADLVTGADIESGDLILGLPSSGVHSNGFSLVRKILLHDHGYTLDSEIAALGKKLGEELLTPTKIYVKTVLQTLKTGKVKGLSHITGGGFYENVPRMLPEGLGAEIDYGSWPVPPIFSFIRETGQLSAKDMFSTFNMGIGMAVVVSSDDAPAVIRQIQETGEDAYIIGRVTDTSGVVIGGAFE